MSYECSLFFMGDSRKMFLCVKFYPIRWLEHQPTHYCKGCCDSGMKAINILFELFWHLLFRYNVSWMVMPLLKLFAKFLYVYVYYNLWEESKGCIWVMGGVLVPKKVANVSSLLRFLIKVALNIKLLGTDTFELFEVIFSGPGKDCLCILTSSLSPY